MKTESPKQWAWVRGGLVVLIFALIVAFSQREIQRLKGELEKGKALETAIKAAQDLEKFEMRDAVSNEQKRGANLNKRLADIQDDVARENRAITDRASLEKQKIKNDTTLAIARERLEIARMESEMATATGERLLKLTQDREAAEIRITDLAEEQAELSRQADERAAVARVESAQNALDQINLTRAGLQSNLTYKENEANDLRAQLQDAKSRRVQMEKP